MKLLFIIGDAAVGKMTVGQELMKITELSPYKGTTWQITTENGGKIFIGQRTVEKMNLKKGMELPDSAIESIKEEDLERKSRERAMYLLSGREYGFVELYRKLEITYPKEMCLRTCKLMAEKGLVNDREYAFRLGKQLFEIKKESAVAVRYKLTQKGIPKDIISEVIDAYCEDDEAVKMWFGLSGWLVQEFLIAQTGHPT